MNDLVHSHYDKFLETTLTYSDKICCRDCGDDVKCYISHIATQKAESFFLCIRRVCKNEKMELTQGDLILNIDGKNITFMQPNETKSSDINLESVNYALSQEQLLMLCNATQIDFRLSGRSSSITGCFDTDMQLICKCMYNAIIDENMFAEEIADKINVIKQLEEKNELTLTETRPLQMKMNKFVTTSYDKFSEFSITMSEDIIWQIEGEAEIKFLIKHYFKHNSGLGRFALRIERIALESLDLAEGILILNADGKNISLKASLNAGFSQYLECVEYDLTQEQLLVLCNAEQIDFKLEGRHFYEIGRLDKSMQFECKCMYNAIVDESMFADDLNEVVECENAKERKDKEIRKTEVVLIAAIVVFALVLFLLGML